MWELIKHAYTTPKLMQTPIDGMVRALMPFVILLLIAGLYLLSIELIYRRDKRRRAKLR